MLKCTSILALYFKHFFKKLYVLLLGYALHALVETVAFALSMDVLDVLVGE